MLSRILNGASAISADMDVRLSRAIGTSPGFWLGLQTDFDLWQAQKRFKARVKRINVPNMPRASE
jgi:addiction module HigA family antidote